MDKKYAKLAAEKTLELLKIDSPSGFTENAAAWVYSEFQSMGYDVARTNKGGVTVNLGGKFSEDALMLEAHVDTLGGMVSAVLPSGRLKITPIGGLNADNVEAENVRVYTRDGRVYTGTYQLANASVHVNTEYSSVKRSFETMEVVLDEDVKSREDTVGLGIETGDFVCFDPRAVITEKGYIKSRFLDDKLSVGALIAFAGYLKDNRIELKRRTYIHVTVYEEVGHGGSSSLPKGVSEAISVDMGCVGDGLNCTERKVSVCAKDSGGPYNYEVVSGLIDAAKREDADYAVDVYPRYGSDVEATLRAGYDVKHGLIGAGVYASHGYERSHIDGVYALMKLLKGYLDIE